MHRQSSALGRVFLLGVLLTLFTAGFAGASHLGSDYWLHCTGSPQTCVEQAVPTVTTTVTTTVTVTQPQPPPPAPPPPAALAPERAIIAIGYDAWAGSDPAALSRTHDLAVFHSPEPGPDENAHRAWEAADPSSVSLVYQSFGMACDNALWTTCGIGSTAQARSGGWLALYNGQEARPSGYPYLTSVNMGKPGYGLTWAQRVASRVGPFAYDGILFDDVNVADSRLPKRGVPDGYASVSAYKDAVKTQLLTARNYLAGYATAANLGGVTEWDPFFFPADDMVGLLDYSLIEFCGQWPNVTSQSEQVWERLLLAGRTASARGKKLWCGGFGSSEAQARYSDHFARIVGAQAHSFSDGNDYRTPFPDFSLFRTSYGTASGVPVREGSHLYRAFQTRTLHVDAATLQGWET